jgi:hypothetical protein
MFFLYPLFALQCLVHDTLNGWRDGSHHDALMSEGAVFVNTSPETHFV